MSTMTSQTGAGSGVRVQIQRFGSYLSGMVMPNIGAFIAFGFITALFIPDGWTAYNADLAEMVGPMITYLIPILIGYTGGKLVYDTRGGVVGRGGHVGRDRRRGYSDDPGRNDHGPAGRLSDQEGR